jgi:hypothetical protein
MRKCANISPYMRRPLVIYDFATAPFKNFLLYEENLIFFIISVLCRCMGIAWFSDGSDCGEDKGLGTNLEMELTDILSPHGAH